MIKRFDVELYNDEDYRAKNKAAKFLVASGFFFLDIPIEEQEEKYTEYDFQIRNSNNKIKTVEVEVKRVWKGLEFPFSTVDVPYRKRKSQADIFIMFNEDCSTLLICDMSTILNAKTKTKDTIYTNNEKFFSIPLSEFGVYEIK